jgi:hypothetical protein
MTIMTAHQDLALRKFRLTNETAEEIGLYRKHFDYVRYVEIANDDSFYISAC